MGQPGACRNSPQASASGLEAVTGMGTTDREAKASPLPTERRPFTVAPALVERGLRGHVDTQNALAQALRLAGIDLRSRLLHEPNFDLAWETNGTVFVAEISRASPMTTKKNSSGSASARSCATATASTSWATDQWLPSSCQNVSRATRHGMSCAMNSASSC